MSSCVVESINQSHEDVIVCVSWFEMEKKWKGKPFAVVIDYDKLNKT